MHLISTKLIFYICKQGEPYLCSRNLDSLELDKPYKQVHDAVWGKSSFKKRFFHKFIISFNKKMKCISQNSTQYIIKVYYILLNESFLFLFGLTPVQKIIVLEKAEFQHKWRESKRKAVCVGRRGSCPK